MTKVLRERITAEIDGEITVFIIGMRVNSIWKIHKWLPVALAMPRMIRELSALEDSGFLGAESWFGNPTAILQYWKSFEHLERYSRANDQAHLPAWAAFNKAMRVNGHVGIWHETYRVRPGDYECIYNNMPPFGLAKATRIVPIVGRRDTAAGRMSFE